jgi:hypothetical protein
VVASSLTEDTVRSRSLIIWSAVLRRSEERKGARGLILTN